MFINTRLYKPLIALILSNENKGKVVKMLNKQKYTADESSAIGVLLDLRSFTPESIHKMKGLMNRVDLTTNEILLFSETFGLNMQLIRGLINFELTVKGGDLIKQGYKAGELMGVEIRKRETELFKKLINNGGMN